MILKRKETLKIYIDGSHLDKQNNGRLGIGGVLIKEGKVVTSFSKELTPDYMRSNFGATAASNPGAELCALLIALQEFKDYLGKECPIYVYADYIGVREWMTGKWRIKEPYIKKIKEGIDSEIKLQNLGSRINYSWVKAHQTNNSDPDTYWNNQVDLLAKGEKNEL